MNVPEDNGLTHRIIGLAMRVHARLGPGLLEAPTNGACATSSTRTRSPSP